MARMDDVERLWYSPADKPRVGKRVNAEGDEVLQLEFTNVKRLYVELSGSAMAAYLEQHRGQSFESITPPPREHMHPGRHTPKLNSIKS
jgi:hypothetical protein